LEGTGRAEDHEEGATANPHRMQRIARMKGQGQRQRHFLWAWRERLCAEKPTHAVAVDVPSGPGLPIFRPGSFFMFFRPSCSSPMALESHSTSGVQDKDGRVYPSEQSFMPFVPFLSFQFRFKESQKPIGLQ
jgi:hypothetical protein